MFTLSELFVTCYICVYYIVKAFCYSSTLKISNDHQTILKILRFHSVA